MREPYYTRDNAGGEWRLSAPSATTREGSTVRVFTRAGKANDVVVGAALRFNTAEPGHAIFAIQSRSRVSAAAPAEAAPAEAAPEAAPVGAANALAEAIAQIARGVAPRAQPINEDAVRRIAAEEAAKVTPRAVRIDVYERGGEEPVRSVDNAHAQTTTLIQYLQAGVRPMLVGPAGAGKTTACVQAAAALGVPFFFCGAVVDRFGLLGFRDANGNVQETQFSRAITQPCVFLFDEIDRSAPEALTAFHAAVDNNIADMPSGQVQVHPGCLFVAAANTYGRGADRLYVAAEQLDAATMDRWTILEWEYDTALEERLAGSQTTWLKRVWQVRERCAAGKIRHIVSSRAVRDGARLLEAGVALADVERACLRRGLDHDTWAKVGAA